MKTWAIPFLSLLLIVVGMYSLGLFESTQLSSPDPSTSPESDVPNTEGDVGTVTDIETVDEEAPKTATEIGDVGEITGRVVAADGAPIAKATLHLQLEERAANEPSRIPALDEETGRSLADGDGRFQYRGLNPDARYSLIVRAAGRVGARRRHLEPNTGAIEVVLQPAVTVSGTVVDPSNQPVSRALVVAGQVVKNRARGLVLPFEDDVVAPVITTDPDGRFSLSGIPRGPFSVTAFHDRWSPSEPLNLTQEQDGIVLALLANTMVEGRVVDDRGSPVKGATVQSVPVSKALAENAPQAITDAEGSFRLDGVPPGVLSLITRADNYPTRTTREPDPIAEGETLTGIEIVLARGARVVGVVVDPTGSPVSGATVSLRRRATLDRLSGPETATNREGSFVLDGFGPDSGEAESIRHLEIVHHQYADTDSEDFLVHAAAEIDLGTITLAYPTVITGHIIDLNGHAIANAPVELLAVDEGSGGQQVVIELFGAAMPVRVFRSARGNGKSDAEGFYLLKVKEPGTYRVAATAKDYQRAESEDLVVGDRSLEDVDIALAPALRIEGIVIDELGVPCEGVVMHATAEGRTQNSQESDVDGRFQIGGLGAGPHQLGIASGGWSLAETLGDIDAGAENVIIVATRPGEIVGRVVDRNDRRPLTLFSVKVGRDFSLEDGVILLGGGNDNGVEYQDPDGRFSIEGVSPGRHRITVRSRGWIEESRVVEVTSGATTEVLIDLEVAGTIIGRLVDRYGDPIAAARVTHEPLGEAKKKPNQPMQISFSFTLNGGDVVFGGGGGAPRVTTDENGNFRIEGLEDGEFRVRFRHGSFRPATEEPIIASRGRETDIGTITMSRGATVSGRVRAEHGARIAWARVTVSSTSGGASRNARVDATGDFTIGGLDAGNYSVTVDYTLERSDAGDGKTHRHSEPSVDLGAEDERDLDITLSTG